MPAARNWRRYGRVAIRSWLPPVVTLAVLGSLALALQLLVNAPWDGMTWLRAGDPVVEVVPGGPAQRAGIRVGDRVVAVESVPIESLYPTYRAHPGDRVILTVEREGRYLELPLELEAPRGRFLALKLLNLATAALFAVLAAAFAVEGGRSRATDRFTTLYELLALALVAGTMNFWNYPWSVKGFKVAAMLLVPAMVHVATSFPLERREPWARFLERLSLVLGVAGAAGALASPLGRSSALARAVDALGPLALTAGLIVANAIIADSFRRTDDAQARAAVRIAVLGLGISVVPLLGLYLVPRLLLGRQIVAPELAMLSLVALPLYHGFAVTRRRFNGLERVLVPLSSWVLSSLVFVAVVLVSGRLAQAVWPTGGVMAVYAGATGGAIALATLNVPVISGARRVVHHAFYGQAYDFQSVVSEMSRDLVRAVSCDELGELVVNTLCRRMKLRGAAFLVLDKAGSCLVSVATSGVLAHRFAEAAVEVNGPLGRWFLARPEPVRREQLLHSLRAAGLSAAEMGLLEEEQASLWIPVVLRGKLRAAAVLGNKQRDALFSNDDLEIAATLAGLLGVSMENAELYDHLRAEMQKLREMQDQLVQAEKLSAIGELVSGVAHELNNPLTAIIGYAELLLGELRGTAAERDLENILRSAERSRRIVRNLLTFARRQRAERRLVDVNELLRETLELQSYQLRVDNIAIRLELDEGLPKTLADPSQLQQVFVNIIMNAHQAIRSVKEAGSIAVRTAVAGDMIRVAISDDGPGIPPDIMGRIFDPFFTTKEVGVGTGLGLSICYGIVSAHGGRIWCESVPGQGATFFVELPIRQEAPEEPAPEPKPAENKHLRVLVVEDEPAVAAVIRRLLSKNGHKVEVAGSAREALGLLRRDREFDALISDVKMPDIDGATLFERLRAEAPELIERVIFITGDTASPDTASFLQRAGRPVLPKPFGAEDLRRALLALVDVAAAERPNADH